MATATFRFKLMGITNDVESCECCGRTGLKRTVVLGILDGDGNTEGVTYYGSNCAARALMPHLTGRKVEVLAEQAQRDADRAARDRIVAVNENPTFGTKCVWVVESIGSMGGHAERLCFATGTRPEIREWARANYPNREINVRKAI